MSRRVQAIVVVLLGLAGVECWLTLGRGLWGKNAQAELALAAISFGAIRPLARRVYAHVRFLRHPRPLMQLAMAVAIALASAGFFWHAALASGRDLFPVMHDELQFLVQTRMLASGHLWMPPHPLPEFFDTFYVLIQPRYAAQSFPGTAFFFLPAVWFHLPAWVVAMAWMSVAVALFYLVVTLLFDGLAGLIAAILLMVLPSTQFVSTAVLAQLPLLVLGFLAVLFFLMWRRRNDRARFDILLLGVGLAAGAALITRPVDALIFILPLTCAFATDWRRMNWQRSNTCVLLLFLAASPCLILQLVFNHGVTGRYLHTPFAFYNERDQPGLGFGLGNQPGIPQTQVPEKQAYYQIAVVPRILEHRAGRLWTSFVNERLPVTARLAMPHPLLCALLPLGFMGVFLRRRWVLGLGVPLFLLLYTPYPLFATHYPSVAAPGAIVLILAGIAALGRAFPRWRASAWLAIFIFAAGLLAIPPQLDGPMLSAVAGHSPVMRVANQALASLPEEPAIVLFTRDPLLSNEFEPVYDLDNPDIDAQRIIRVHDRGADNRRLFQYYASSQPDRTVYRFDESNLSHSLTLLGKISVLAQMK